MRLLAPPPRHPLAPLPASPCFPSIAEALRPFLKMCGYRRSFAAIAFSRMLIAQRGAAPDFLRVDLIPSPTLSPTPSTRNPQPSTLNPQPSTLNSQPSTQATGSEHYPGQPAIASVKKPARAPPACAAARRCAARRCSTLCPSCRALLTRRPLRWRWRWLVRLLAALLRTPGTRLQWGGGAKASPALQPP